MKTKAMLFALPTYPLSCLPLAKHTNKNFEAKFINFLWNNLDDSKKLALIKWDNICRPKGLGGLGIKKLSW